MVDEVTIYTDGGCGRQDRRGGWAAILLCTKDDEVHSREISGANPCTTSNRMEIKAVFEGLRALKRPCHVTVYSDSQYVVNSIGQFKHGVANPRRSGWINDWRKRGWARKEGALKNNDLWQLIYSEVSRHKSVTLVWVKGHNEDYYNERCDELATEAIRKLRDDLVQGDGLHGDGNGDGPDGPGILPETGVGDSLGCVGPAPGGGGTDFADVRL